MRVGISEGAGGAAVGPALAAEDLPGLSQGWNWLALIVDSWKHALNKS